MPNGKAQSNKEQAGKLKTKGGMAMINKMSLALMSKKEDLEDLHSRWFHLPDWCPTHHYTGTLTIEDHSLVFHGRDTKEKRSFAETIPLSEITNIPLGLDKRFKGDANLLLDMQGVKPLRICYQSNGGRQTAYILTNFSRANGRSDDNRDWYKTLKKYVNGKEEIIA